MSAPAAGCQGICLDRRAQASGERQGVDPGGSRALEDPRAFLDRGAGGEDVIDHYDLEAANGLARLEGEGAAHVAQPALGSEFPLGGCAPLADQPVRRYRRTVRAVAKELSELSRKIPTGISIGLTLAIPSEGSKT